MNAFPEPRWRANALTMAANAEAFPILSSVLLLILKLAGSVSQALGAFAAAVRSIWPQVLAPGAWRWGSKAALALGTPLLGLGACQSDMSPDVATPSDSLRMATDAEIATLRLDTATVFGLSTEGAFLEAAYSDSALRRLRATYYGETGRAAETFYYDAAGLAVVHRVDVRYTTPLSGQVADSTVRVLELRPPETSRAVADSVSAEGAKLVSLLRASRQAR